MSQTASQASEKAWTLAVPQRTVLTPKALAEEVAKLRLPRVATRRSGGDAWQSQTYQQFADEAQTKNRDLSFTKDLMDESFRKAVSLVPKDALRGCTAQKENMITRVRIV